MQRWFITGTDTEVGKTVVTACLARAARARGTVLAAKPVASGVDLWPGEDAATIAAAAGHPPKVHTTYEAPVSPHRAALLEDRPLDVEALGRWLDELHADTVLVEGVGGWAVPLRLDPRYEVVDLANRAGGQVIVVAADRLGVLNHTRLTVDAIRAAGLSVAAVVLNTVHAEGDPSRDSNQQDLAELLDVPVVRLLHLAADDPDGWTRAGNVLWEAIC